jgi:hypothetical protein
MTVPFPVHAMPRRPIDPTTRDRWSLIARSLTAEGRRYTATWNRDVMMIGGKDIVLTARIGGRMVEVRLFTRTFRKDDDLRHPSWSAEFAGLAMLEAISPSPTTMDVRDLHHERAAWFASAMNRGVATVHSAIPWVQRERPDAAMPHLLQVSMMPTDVVDHVGIDAYTSHEDAAADPVGHMRRLAAWRNRPESRQ